MVQANISFIKGLATILLITIKSALCFAPVNKHVYGNKPAAAQAYPSGYFSDPLDIPIKLAANFGELRTNHFHMGFDIRTNQHENLPVFAAADGYVSRIKIEKSGFGRAIYITHPNGYVTLYAHLNAFYPALNEYVISRQYQDRQWEQEFTLLPGQFPVTRGQFIANSGNTGGSAGPHLHFEIRDAKTGNNLNPWLFGFDLPDHIPPVLHRLYYYDRRFSTYETTPQPIATSGGNGKYFATAKVVTLSSPYISFGISAEDKTSSASFNFGIYEADLAIDDTLRTSFRLNDFSYNETRYLNGSIDYKNRLSGGSYIQHLSRLPGNKLSAFFQNGNGIFAINDTLAHIAKIDIKDAAGNVSVLQFAFRCGQVKPMPAPAAPAFTIMSPNVENIFAAEDIVAAFSPLAFYDTVHLVHTSVPAAGSNAVSNTHYLHNYKVPVHDSFSVRIKPETPPADEMKSHIVMKMVSNKKNEIVKGKWINDWMEARFRDFGNFTLLIDTLSPVINLYGWVNGSNLSNRKGFAITATDNLGEVKNVTGYVDGQWILFSKKDNLFIHNFDGRIIPGHHELKITVEDEAGNISEKTYYFTR